MSQRLKLRSECLEFSAGSPCDRPFEVRWEVLGDVYSSERAGIARCADKHNVELAITLVFRHLSFIASNGSATLNLLDTPLNC